MQNVDNIIQAINLCCNPSNSDIKQGQNYIESQQTQPGYLLALMMIADNTQNTINVRQFAVTNLKNTVVSFWKQRDNKYTIPTEDKAQVRSSILDALIRCADNRKLMKVYKQVVYDICAIDFPQDWPDFSTQIVKKLEPSENFNEIFGCLIALSKLVANYEFMMGVERKPLENIIAQVFPTLQNLSQKLMENYSESTAAILTPVLKIYHSCIHTQMPALLQDPNVLNTWLVFFKMILDANTPEEINSLTEDEEEIKKRQQNALWKNKKWVGRIMQRFIQKYANEKLANKEEGKITELFLGKYAQPFLETFTAILFKSKQVFVSKMLLHFALKYIFYSLRYDQTFNVLHPHLDKIMLDICLPLLAPTQTDNELWQTDPNEYIRREEDYTNSYQNLKGTAVDLIEQICKRNDPQGKPYINTLVTYSATCFQSGVDPRNNSQITLAYREGLLLIFGHLKELIMKEQILSDQIEVILEKFIIPEFKNTVGFLRARACWVFGKYGQIEFKNKQNVANAVSGICACLMDSEIPVKFKAATALNCVLYQTEAHDMIKPNLQEMLQIYIKLMDQIDNEDLVSSLEAIIEQFSAEITPFAYELCGHLTAAFFKYREKDVEDDVSDDGECEMAAVGCLDAIRKILNSPLQQEVYTKCEGVIIPVINFALNDENCDYAQEIIGLINLIIFKSQTISQQMWFYYPILCYIITGVNVETSTIQGFSQLNEEQKALLESAKKGWGIEFIEHMLGAFKNYIGKGKDFFLQTNDLFGRNFVDLLFDVVDKVYEVGNNGDDDVDQMCATTLYISLIENNVGTVDYLIPRIVDKCLQNMQISQKSKQIKVINIEVISLVIWYNPTLAFQYLESKQITGPLFQEWFALLPHFKADFDKQRMMLGLASIFRLPQNQIPSAITASFAGLMKHFVKLTTEILELREKDCDDDEAEDEEDPEKEKQDYYDTLKKLQGMNNGQSAEGNDDDDEDDEDFDDDYDGIPKYNLMYDSPLEEIDEIMFLEKQMMSVMQNNSGFYESICGFLDENEKQTLNKNFESAKQQFAEYCKNLEEEKAAKVQQVN